MKSLDVAIIFLRIQALLYLFSALFDLTYIPNYLIPDGDSAIQHFMLSRAFFMLDVRILLNALAAFCLWKYALPIGRFVIAAMPKVLE